MLLHTLDYLDFFGFNFSFFIDFCQGMPIGLRSMIYQENQGDWYKQMYNSIHRPKRHNDFNNRLTLEEQST